MCITKTFRGFSLRGDPWNGPGGNNGWTGCQNHFYGPKNRKHRCVLRILPGSEISGNGVFRRRSHGYLRKISGGWQGKNILQSLETVIRNGKKALFIGTGCKVAAAINHLKGKELDQSLLYTIDLICYGVPPVKTYTDFVSKLKRKYLSIQVGRQMPHLSLQGQ